MNAAEAASAHGMSGMNAVDGTARNNSLIYAEIVIVVVRRETLFFVVKVAARSQPRLAQRKEMRARLLEMREPRRDEVDLLSMLC